MLKNFLLSMFIVISLPLASLWYISHFKLQKEIELKVNDDLSQVTEILATEINDWTEMNLKLLKQNSSLAQIKSGIESEQRPVLKSIIHTYRWLYLAYAIGSDGYKTARSDNKPILNPDGTKAHYRGDRAYFKQILDGSSIGQQLVLSRTLNEPAFILCRVIIPDRLSLETSGALCIGSTVDQLSDSVVNTKIGNTGYAVLLDDSNKVIAHGGDIILKEKLQDFSNKELFVKALLNKTYLYQEDSKKMIGFMKSVGMGWHLIVTQDYDDAYSAYIDSIQNSMFLFFATIIFSVAIAYLMARRLARPIENMTIIANDIRKGTFYNSIEESKRSDEIGELARAIEKMSISISIAIRKLKSRNKIIR
jgi:methyl-accepting chemotaxis protein